MKKFTIISLILLTANILFINNFINSQEWQWQNPLPQGNDLLCTYFINSDIGFAVGDGGTIIKTINGGETWTIQESGTDVDLKSVFFVDENIGYTAGYNPYNYHKVFLKTTDGGTNWFETNNTLSYLWDIFFISADTGFVVRTFSGGGPDHGYVQRTTDGGYTWDICYDTTEALYSVYFPSKNVGYAVGGIIMKTIDGGSTWTPQNVPNSIFVHDVYFIDENIGFAVKAHGLPIGATLKTIDGGANWIIQSTGEGYLNSVFFMDEMNGYGAGDFGVIKKTTNGGINWTDVNSGTSKDLNSLCFIGSSGYIVGNDGVLLKSMDGGTTWVNQLSGETNHLHSTYFTDGHTGYAVGESGLILKTMDAGANWLNMSSGTINYLNSIFFIDTETGYVAGTNGTILKSNNAGSSWTGLVSGTSADLNSIFFPNNTTGYVAGTNGTILKTADGGENWTSLVTGTDNNLTSVFFTNEYKGYVVGIWDWGSILLSTTDGGTSWTTQSCIDHPKSVFFPEEDTGYVVGKDAILKTTNGGESWYELEYFPASGCYLQSVYFINSDVGYVVGHESSSVGGKIFKTMTGGEGFTPWEEQNTRTSQRLNSIYFPNADTGFIVGNNGTILNTINGIPVGIETFMIHNSKSAIQCYPNPVSKIGTIEFELKQPSVVSIQIFNNTGEKVYALGNRIFPTGFNSISWNASNLKEGIYFCQIQIGNDMETRKIIKVN